MPAAVPEKKAPSHKAEPRPRCSVKIKKAVKKTVDENHPVVLKCVKAGYTMEQSIDAVAKCGSVVDSLSYLARADLDEDDNEAELFPTSNKHHLFPEESPENSFTMYEHWSLHH